MKGELVLVDILGYENDEFSICPSVHDFSLSIYIDEEKSLEKQLKNKQSFDECMESIRNFRIEFDEVNEEEEKMINYIENNFDNLFDDVEYICLSFKNILVRDFIEENPKILTKKIVLDEVLSITDYDKLIVLMDEYDDMLDKVYVSFIGNDNYVSLNDCYKTMNILKKQADEIKELGLSPMEEIMYVYDQVRNRVYTHENSDDEYFKSRDLSQVLLGDKIVCVGYANIFNALLTYLGIKSYTVHLENSDDKGHVRNVIYVKDSKYDIDGVYYFDSTWDSKKAENDNSYLYRYKYFAKTRSYMEEHNNSDFKDKFCPLYFDDIYEKVKSIVESGDISKLKLYRRTINYMGNIVGEKELLDFRYVLLFSSFYEEFSNEVFLEKFKMVVSKFKKEIPAEVMIELLNNVRRLEYYQDPNWYPYSIDDIYRTIIMSDWNFKEEHIDKEEKLIRLIFGDDYLSSVPRSKKKDFISYGKEGELFKKIEQVRLTKVLQKTLSKKKV